MFPRARTIQFALFVAIVSPAAEALTAQQATTGNLVGTGIGIGYVALSVGAVVRLVGHAREANVGDRIRDRSASGTLTTIDSDSVTIRSEAGDRRLARADLRGLRVYEGRERKWAQGWGIGLVSGGAVGALIGATSPAPADDPNCDFICPTREGDAVIGGVALGLAGSVVGALIGAATQGQHWSRINGFAERTSVQVAPRMGALAVQARISF